MDINLSSKSEKPKNELDFFVYSLKTNRFFLLGLLIVSLMVLLAIFAPVITPYHPEEAIPADFLQPPNSKHWFGTDNFGMDIFSRVIWAPRVDLVIAVGATFGSLLIGVPLGVWAGYYGNKRGYFSLFFHRKRRVFSWYKRTENS